MTSMNDPFSFRGLSSCAIKVRTGVRPKRDLRGTRARLFFVAGPLYENRACADSPTASRRGCKKAPEIIPRLLLDRLHELKREARAIDDDTSNATSCVDLDPIVDFYCEANEAEKR